MYNFTLRFHNTTYKYEEKGHVYDFFKTLAIWFDRYELSITFAE